MALAFAGRIEEVRMPFIQVTMLEGRTIEQKHDLMRRLTDAAAAALGGDPARIRVALYEVSPDDWAIGGETISTIRPHG
jgi:4-oxalocrotonate tautomerase